MLLAMATTAKLLSQQEGQEGVVERLLARTGPGWTTLARALTGSCGWLRVTCEERQVTNQHARTTMAR